MQRIPRPPAISVDKKPSLHSPPRESSYLTESPQSPQRKRKARPPTQKTTEQLIYKSHEEVLDYIETIDRRVQDIIGKHEGEFLLAYQTHVKRVREEVEEIKKKSMHNENSQQNYLQKIASLEKQLIIFREESLRLFQKVNAKDKQIEALKFKLQEAQADNRHIELSLTSMLKRNKLLEMKQRGDPLGEQSNPPDSHPDTLNKNRATSYKRKMLFSFKDDPQFDQTSIRMENVSMKLDRPRTTLASKGVSLQLKNNLPSPSEFQWLVERLQERAKENTVQISDVIQIMESNRSLLTRQAVVKPSYRSTRQRSTIIRDDNELQSIFFKSVEEVKKDILRRKNGPSLNFFKQNGAVNLQDFKKMDYFVVLETFLSHPTVVQAIHAQIFTPFKQRT